MGLNPSNVTNDSSGENMDIYRLTVGLETRGILTISIEFLFLFLIISVALVANALIFIAFYRQPRLRITSNYYILSLAILDFTTATLIMPLTLGAIVQGKWLYGYLVCQIQGFLVATLGFSTVFVMLLVSINRFIRLIKPDKYNSYFSLRKTIMSLTLGPVFSATGTVVYGSTFYFHPGKLFCIVLEEASLKVFWRQVVVFFFWLIIPFIIIGFCYQKVRKKIRTHQSQVRHMNTSGRINIAEIKATKGLFAIILAFLLCYLQIPFIDLLSVFITIPRQVYVFYTYMAAVSSAINPFIYNATNSTLKAEFKKILMIRRINPQIQVLQMR